MELILKAKDIRVEFTGRDVLDIDELDPVSAYPLVQRCHPRKKGFHLC